jgi:ribonuclease R
MILLRSLCQAVYSVDNVGHFGLAFPTYTHFTSPIRRYPDLLVHRQLKLVLHNKWKASKTKKDLEIIAKQNEKFKELAYHCSITERRADDASRDVELWLKCQYIAKYIGKTFTGVISGVNSFGFFVELDELYIDGLVHVNTLRDDYYIYNHVRHQLLGERTKKQYTLGLPVKVIVAKVNVDERKVDFVLVEESGKASPVAKGRKGKKKKK